MQVMRDATCKSGQELLDLAPTYWGDECSYCGRLFAAGQYDFVVVDYFDKQKPGFKSFLRDLFKLKPKPSFRKSFCSTPACEQQAWPLAEHYNYLTLYTPQIVKHPITKKGAYLTPDLLKQITEAQSDPRMNGC